MPKRVPTTGVRVLAVDPKGLASRAGLNKLAGFLVAGAIAPRISMTAPLPDAAAILDQLRHGGMHGKAVIRI